MAGILSKAMAGAGKGITQVSLINLEEQVLQRREQRLQEFKKGNKPKFSDYGKVGTTAGGAEIYGQKVEGTGELKGVQVVKPDRSGKETKSDRQLVLAKKISLGKATKEEQSEYFLLVNADPLQQMRMQMGMNVPSAGEGNAAVDAGGQVQTGGQAEVSPLTALREGQTLTGPDGGKATVINGIPTRETPSGREGWVNGGWRLLGGGAQAIPAVSQVPADPAQVAAPAPAQTQPTGIEGLKSSAQIAEEKRLASPEYRQDIISQDIQAGQQAFTRQREEMAGTFGIDQAPDADRGAQYQQFAQAFTEVSNQINQGLLPEDPQQVQAALQFAQGTGNTAMVTQLQAVLQRISQ